MKSSFWASTLGVSGTNLWLSKFTRQTLILSACFVMSAPLSGCGGDRPQTTAESPASAATNPEDGGAIAPLTGSTPPDAEVRPLKPGQSGRPLGPDGLPQLQAKGINYEQLFTERLENEDKRFDRVETAVLELRRDFESVLPSMMRLVAIEGDIKNLVGQLETLLENEPMPAPMIPVEPVSTNPVPPMIEDLAPEPSHAPAPREKAATPPVNEPTETMAEKLAAPQVAEAAPTAITPVAAAPPPEPEVPEPAPTVSPQATPPPAPTPAPAPAASATPVVAGEGVSALRFGVDGDKTRIVFDVGAPVTYKKDLDNGENLLVIELPNLSWKAATAGTPPASALVQSWSAQPMDGGGTRVVMILKKPVTVSYEATLKPETSSPHHRLVLDLRSN